MAREMPDGKDRLRARIALAFAALSLPAPASALRSATRNLAEELDRQILPDGGHISRNPLTVLELLADLLPLRQTYANQAETPPAALIGAIDRMLPALRFFRHQDGSLARFNGMGATIHDRIAAILRHDDTAGAPLLHAPHSGYERLSMGGTTVIADTGAAAADRRLQRRACRLPVLRDVVRPPAFRRQLPASTPMAPPNSGRWRAPPRRIRPRRSTTPRRRASTIRSRVNDLSARR